MTLTALSGKRSSLMAIDPTTQTRQLTTYLLPDLIPANQKMKGSAVVIDILRASSTICSALESGASAVIPCEHIETAQLTRKDFDDDTVLMGGERQGVKIEGFDLGNSPRDYTKDVVENRTLIFSTTNGTRALHRCQTAQRVAIGCFLNRSPIVNWLQQDAGPIHLVCAGTDGKITLEDCLFAGAVAEGLISRGDQLDMNDATRLCLNLYHMSIQHSEGIHLRLLESQGGQNLQHLSMEEDVAFCAQVDVLENVPVWDSGLNRINND
ncbi:MAG TPA: 2-phosphosulfolactate phosphatase [Planctomycetaceae bacterium]|nr:2-phosphosulfolactate phosphatase [Planctomycetaceae bacterium]